MKGQPSRTALFAAAMRAAHRVLDAPPRILDDELAIRLAGFDSEEALRDSLPRVVPVGFSGIRAFLAIRHRYAEDELAVAMDTRELRQYVVLGAGLDSFAHRAGARSAGLRIFEVDREECQRWKRSRLSQLGVRVPPNLRYVSVDLESEPLSSALEAGGVCLQEPVFFSWLGVTQYLTEEAVLSTLSCIAEGTAEGSSIVFDFNLQERLLDDTDREVGAWYAKGAAAMGEPWRSLFDPHELEIRLRGLGFPGVAHLSKADATKRYLEGREDGLTVPGYAQLVMATK